MSSEFLSSFIGNTTGFIKNTVPEFSQNPEFYSAIELSFNLRQHGSCQFLLSGNKTSYFDCLHRSAGLYLFYLQQGDEAEKRLSENDPFFDAITAGLFDGVKALAQHARKTWNDDYEYEEDFLYTHFLLNYFFMQEGNVDCKQLLNQYKEVLSGDSDVRFDLCKAFYERDPVAFSDSFSQFLDEREQEVNRNIESETIGEEEWSWSKYISVEALALLKMAEMVNFQTEKNYSQAPELLRSPPAMAFNPDLWRQV